MYFLVLLINPFTLIINKISNNRGKSIAIPFPTFIEEDGERKFVKCSLCKHYRDDSQQCKLFNRNALRCRMEQKQCGYAAKYFEKDDFISIIKKQINIIIFRINQLLFQNNNLNSTTL